MRFMMVALSASILLTTACGSERERRIDLALKEYEVEPRGHVFSGLVGADGFIDKFKLSSDEIELIGEWYSSSMVEQKNENERGIGYSVSFLPNRVFIGNDHESEYDKNGNFIESNIYQKIGYWKVDRGILFIKPVYIYLRTDLQEPGEYKTKKRMDTDYYPIWKVDLYESAAVQRGKFYYDKIPEGVRSFFKINIREFLRARYLIGLSFDGRHDSLYQKDKEWFEFLMNPDIDDEQYNNNLRVMAIIGDMQGGYYDFTTNKYKLDFSRWSRP